MRAFDPRLTPARADLAARTLEGKVKAARYVDGRAYEVIEPQAPLRAEPAPDAPLSTEALKGEGVTIYDMNAEGWAWGQLAADGYVGWLPSNALVPPGAPPTHKVTALRTLAFPGPSIKLPPLEALPLGARLDIVRIADRMAVTRAGAYVPAAHLAPLDISEPDFVAVAERFLGAPVAAAMALAKPTRGDLVFWKGHVAIVRDRATLIHANAFHMAVAIEPVAAAIARIRATGVDVASVRRIAA